MPFAFPKLPPVKYEAILLAGGLDLVSPLLNLKPGHARDAINFEVASTGGYSRITGYERVDGRAAPSSALTQQLLVGTFVEQPVKGVTVNGEASNAIGVVSAFGVGYVAVTKVVGNFVVGENLRQGTTVWATILATGGTQGPRQDAIIDAASADIYRADIQMVPGTGPVRGVLFYNDVLYAFRDDVTLSKSLMYKATTNGWLLMPFDYEVPFIAGSGTIMETQQINQGANTATIKRVAIQMGDLQAGTATGYLIISQPTPGAFAAGAATTVGGGAGTGALTLTGASAQITRPVGGHYEFVIDNFSGLASTRRVYGCDGAGTGFEFDGTVFAPIRTGTPGERPMHVASFKKHLFFSFASSIIHSGIGAPFNWSALAGASELAVGDIVTGLIISRGEQQGGAMTVYGRNSTSVLYGTSAADWQLVAYGEGTGGLRYSAQYLSEPYVLDDRGVITVATSLNYGNFDQASLTANLLPYIRDKRTRIAASVVQRTKSQYRLFFSDGSGLFMTIVNGKYQGAFPVRFEHSAFCAFAGETSAGDEVSFFGGNSGFVYQLERGPSFDGEPLTASFTLGYDGVKSPRVLKQFRHAALEMTGFGYAEIDFGYLLGYGSLDLPQPGQKNYVSPFAPALWDQFVWDNFIWDGRTIQPTEAEVRGSAENIAVIVSSGTNYVAPFTVNSVILHYTPRRGLR